MDKLTPYDTGDRLEPALWLPNPRLFKVVSVVENFGKVDFDDDEGATRATIWVERHASGRYFVHVDAMDDTLGLVLNTDHGSEEARDQLDALTEAHAVYEDEGSVDEPLDDVKAYENHEDSVLNFAEWAEPFLRNLFGRTKEDK